MASKRRLRRKQCEGKSRHATAEAALIQLHRIKSKSTTSCGQLNVYKCSMCGSYHVGHTIGGNGIGSGYKFGGGRK